MQNTIAAAVSEYTVISGEVLEINDSSLTLLLDMDEAPNGEAPDGQMPEKPDGEVCIWKLTDDCTVTSLTNNGTIDFNGYTITLADGSVLK